ncbi:MAG: efflux RND transporter periplasmic adaptor subunit [Candidatus Acidiferrales bacterium]
MAVLAILQGCSGDKPAAGPPPAVEVKATPVVQRSTPIYSELVGEIRASQEVELRARIGGILLKKHFQDGTIVQRGQVLFTIDPREPLAALADTKAQLAEAEASHARARAEVERYRPLVAENAISKQVYDNTVTEEQQAAARVDAVKAAIAQAQLSVGYTTIEAPLTGRIGKAEVFEGALIAAGSTLLATVSVDDPAWVYFNISETQLLDFYRRYGTKPLPADHPIRRVSLTLADGNRYPHAGRIDFAERAVAAETGTFALRATFPNPGHVLRPGLYGHVRVQTDFRENALLIPERAVRELLGRYSVTIVGAEDKAEVREVTLGPRVNGHWVVESGLQAGDRVLVEGSIKAAPGTPLQVTVVNPSHVASPSASSEPK